MDRDECRLDRSPLRIHVTAAVEGQRGVSLSSLAPHRLTPKIRPHPLLQQVRSFRARWLQELT